MPGHCAWRNAGARLCQFYLNWLCDHHYNQNAAQDQRTDRPVVSGVQNTGRFHFERHEFAVVTLP